MAFMLGENVGSYRLVEQLGQGGMATVYKAYHARLDRYVAIKALHPAFMEDPNFLARFQREARVVASLEHSNIVPIYDFAEHGGRPYLVLKYVQGETLKARLLRSEISIEEIGDIFEAVSSALAYAHKEGVLHRDIKPSNVLVAEDGRIYLADFGLARIAQAGESTLSTDMMLGTPQYISPEQAKGVSDLNQGTDIYSLGVMMYELLVGRVPFSADTPFSIIHDHIYSPLPLPHEVNPGISNEVERVLLKSLAKDREDRYQDIPAMAKAFQGLFEGVGKIDRSIAASPIRVEKELTLPPTPAVKEAKVTRPAVELAPDPVSVPPPAATSPTISSVPAATLSPPLSITEEKAITPPSRKRSIPTWVWWMVLPAFILLCLGGIVVKRATESPGPMELIESVEREIREVSDVQADVGENPGDPSLHMELAIVYWESGQFQEAKEEATKAFDFAQDDPQLYIEFGDMLAGHSIWVYAAPSYILAERNISNPPEELYDLIHQAVYLAAFDPMAEEMLLNSSLDIEPEMLELVEGRIALMNNDFAQAEHFLNSVLEKQPDMPEAHLFEVELLMASGDIETALQALQDLEERDDLPAWVQQEIRQMRQEEVSYIDAPIKDVEDQRGSAEAMQKVSDNPDDPMAQVNLAIAYWEEGRTQDAKNTAYHAFDLTEGDTHLYREIGDIFAERQIWLFAAPAYLLANKNATGTDGDIYDLINEAVYFAAFEDEALEILDDPRLDLNPLLLDLVEIRHDMEKGELDRAEDLLRSFLDHTPDMVEAHLLEADLLGKRGEFEAAKQILLDLQREENLPEWVRTQTQELWRKFDEQE